MQVFLQIVDRGSLTAAARHMDYSLPSVVRTLAALETHLGVRLLNRTTRRIALTTEGREYLERCRRILADVNETERAFTERRASPQGRVTLTAPVTFGERHVAPLVMQFAQRHPAISVELLLVDRVVNLLDEGVDLAVRLGELADSSTVAVRVGHTRQVVCASPGLLKSAGTPRHPRDLARLPCLRLLGGGSLASWEFAVEQKPLRVAVSGPIASNTVGALVDACVRGLGFGRFLEYQVAGEVARGQLRRVLVSFERAAVPIHIVYPHARLVSTRVRALVDWLKPRLQP